MKKFEKFLKLLNSSDTTARDEGRRVPAACTARSYGSIYREALRLLDKKDLKWYFI